MAIVQVSRITARKGLTVDLPQPLAGAELGWAIDERRLFIGNGTLADGAPSVGNTEILTEYSDIFANRTNFAFGDYVILAGTTATLDNNVTTQTLYTIDAVTIPAFQMRYMIRRGNLTRTGTYIIVASTDGTGGSLATSDANPVQNGSTGVTFTISESSSTVTVAYSTTNTGITGTLYYSLSYLAI